MGRPNRKRKYTKPVTNNRLFRVLIKIALAIRAAKIKNQHLIEEWLRKYADYIYLESSTTFESENLGRYKAGDIIFAEFGYNVGSEYGGKHYAIVMENSSPKANMIMVVPLSSLPPNKNAEDVHYTNAYLGELPQLNKISKMAEGTKSFAVINQTRAIAKQRIIAPKNPYHERIYINGDLIRLIYEKFKERYTSMDLKRKSKE